MWSSLKSRIARLEARWRRPLSHHRVVVQVPWGADPDAYLAALPCLCGADASCPDKSHGLVVPAPMSSVTWQDQAQAYYAQMVTSDSGE